MVYFLYTGKIAFAPFSSDPRHTTSAVTRKGDWNMARIPCPSAKSAYRLADKVTDFTYVRRSLSHWIPVRHTSPQRAGEGTHR